MSVSGRKGFSYSLNNLATALGMKGKGDVYIFVNFYTVIKWGAAFDGGKAKGFWGRMANRGTKFMQSGHGGTVVGRTNGESFISWMEEDHWDHDQDRKDLWARKSKSTDTYAYAVEISESTFGDYKQVAKRLKKKEMAYSELKPNVPCLQCGEYHFGEFQSCLSQAQLIMSEMGMKNLPISIGWWNASFSNWYDWAVSFVPTSYRGNRWRYYKVANHNTMPIGYRNK